jgi:large subunit ribosomal protein L21
MTYAIIEIGGKQYRVREGERLLVDRLAHEDGAAFAPTVLLVGGDGGPQLAPSGSPVKAKVLREAKGPKIRIGKYKKRTGYRRHTGFRAALSEIEIESIGGGSKRPAGKAAGKTAKDAAPPAETVEPVEPSGGAPAGYENLTIAQIKADASTWTSEQVAAALSYEQEHAKRKGAISALESELSAREGGEE